MELHISDNKLRRALADQGSMKRQFGKDMASKLAIRLGVLRNAQSLADFWPPLSGPERCHELKGGLKGVFSVDLKQPYRLLFKPVKPSASEDRNDELKRWKGITAIEITAIEDTHG
jgi:plasmid maintenance system killer protein